MTESMSERRMAENEIFFRQQNESVQQGLEELKKLAKASNQESYVQDTDTPLHFYCECSDENCRKRVIARPSQYKAIHKKRDQFVVVCGHEVPTIEKIVREGSEFCVVKKYYAPPGYVNHLNPTETSNT